MSLYILVFHCQFVIINLELLIGWLYFNICSSNYCIICVNHLTQKVADNRRGYHSSSKRKIFAFIFFYHYYYGLEAPKLVISCMCFVIFP